MLRGGLAQRIRKLKSIVDYFNKVWPMFDEIALLSRIF